MPTVTPWLAIAAALAADAPFKPAVQVGTLQVAALTEASGMAPSRRDPGVLWLHNDSGNAPVLYAVDRTGAPRGAVRVTGVANRDWEELASFEHAGTPYLLVGEVGDNKAVHPGVSLVVVEEPRLDAAEVAPAWTVSFTWPDGPRDAEALAVEGDSVLIISKRTRPPELFTVPLRPDGPVVAQRLGPVAGLPASEEQREHQARAWPTAMDLLPGGRGLVLLTYTSAWLYPRAAEQSWAEALLGAPLQIPLPALKQAEALCAHPDGSVTVTSEGGGAPLLTLLPAG